MRTLPAGWPDPEDVVTTLPSLYLYLPGSSWPPADSEKGLPAGYALIVGSGSIHRQFTGALMPGQVRAPSGFTIAEANCVIAQPSSGRLAPWKTGSYKIASGGPAQIIASYDGPTGSTAFSLGKFRLDPIMAKASDETLSVRLLDGMISLRQVNKIRQFQVTAWTGDPTDATNNTYDPSDLINDTCTELGISCITPDLGTTLTSIWFDPKKDTLTCLQELVAANLAAITSDEDGAVQVHRFEDLNGGTALLDAIVVEKKFDDLEFTVDPDDAYDRIELTYKRPSYYSPGSTGTTHFNANPDWTAPEALLIPAGEYYEATIYPKRAILSRDPYVGRIQVYPNSNGTGTVQSVPIEVTPISTGRYKIRIGGLSAPYYVVQPGGDPAQYLIRTDGTPIFPVAAVHDTADDSGQITISSGVNAEDAFNSLSIDLGVYIQNAKDAQMILGRITAITSVPRFRLSTVRVPLDLRRQLVDSYALTSADDELDLQMKGMVTAYDISWSPGEMAQTLDLAVLPFSVADLSEVWSGETVADFSAHWTGKTIADLNADPLSI